MSLAIIYKTSFEDLLCKLERWSPGHVDAYLNELGVNWEEGLACGGE